MYSRRNSLGYIDSPFVGSGARARTGGRRFRFDGRSPSPLARTAAGLCWAAVHTATAARPGRAGPTGTR